MTAAPTTFDPATMDLATVVAFKLKINGEPIDGVHHIPYWAIHATLKLIGGRADPTLEIAMAELVRLDPQQSRSAFYPELLPVAAERIHEAAGQCRASRWAAAGSAGVKPAPLDPRIYCSTRGRHDGTTVHPEQPSVISLLHQADTAGMLGFASTERWRELGGQAAHDALHGVIPQLTRYPNIPPATEVELAAGGFTTAECLLVRLARCAWDLAEVYRAAQVDINTVYRARNMDTVPSRPSFAAIGRDAALLADGAIKTIEEGVRHTLRVARTAA